MRCVSINGQLTRDIGALCQYQWTVGTLVRCVSINGQLTRDIGALCQSVGTANETNKTDVAGSLANFPVKSWRDMLCLRVTRVRLQTGCSLFGSNARYRFEAELRLVFRNIRKDFF